MRKNILKFVIPAIIILAFSLSVFYSKEELNLADYLSFTMILLTYFYVIFTWEMLEKLKKESYLEKRPYLISDFESENSFLRIYVKNIGKTPAKNVEIQIRPDIKIFDNKSLNQSIFKEKILFFPPEKQIGSLINTTPEFFKNESSEYEISLSYSDVFDRIFEEKIILNLEHHKSQMYLPQKDITDIVKSLDKIKEELNLIKRVK